MFEVSVDRRQDVVEAVVAQDLTQVLVHDASFADRFVIEDVQGFAKPKNLVQRLRESREIQGRLFRRRILESELLAEDRLAASRDADDQVDRILEQAAVEDLVKARIAARQPLDQGRTVEGRPGRARALVPRRSRTVETRFSDSRGLRRNAAAPSLMASSPLSIAETASTCAVLLAANSPQSLKPEPPERSRSMMTRSGKRSSKWSRARVASVAMATS